MLRRASRPTLFVLLATCGFLAAAPGTAAAQPRIANATVQTLPAAGGLEASLESLARGDAGAFWAGYSVPVAGGERWMCCEPDRWAWSSGAGPYGCRLESTGASSATTGTQPADTAVRLEAAREMMVLVRVEGGQVRKVRTFSADCPLDGGGLGFFWLTEVKVADSLAWLSRQARTSSADASLARQSVAAIALHADEAADTALETFVAPGQPLALRRHVAFWLGEARGQRGLATLQRLAGSEPDAALRREVTFGLSVSKEPGALPVLLRMAREDSNAAVRGQALFWLARKAGDMVAATLSDAAANDPETQVKERAVAGLSRLPNGEGIPLLIKVARTSPDPAVRKRAIFWLGQSKDARALDFIEGILTGR